MLMEHPAKAIAQQKATLPLPARVQVLARVQVPARVPALTRATAPAPARARATPAKQLRTMMQATMQSTRMMTIAKAGTTETRIMPWV